MESRAATSRTCLNAKIHPRRKSRMQSSSAARDSSSTQLRRLEPGQPGKACAEPDGRESGQPENQSAGNAEGPGIQGDLEISSSASQGCGKCGATRGFGPGKTGRGQTRGNSGGCQTVPEDPRSGATRRAGRRRYRKTGRRGNSTPGQSAPPKDASIGATRNSIAGKAGDARGATRRRIRGAARRREEAGRPAEPLKPAAQKYPNPEALRKRSNSGPGATRKFRAT